MKKTVLLFTCITLIFISCKSDDSEQSQPPKTYTNDFFELEAAKDWKLVNEMGTDTYVGYYFKTPDTIRFSCGLDAFGTIDEVEAQANTIYFEETEIDNCPSKIVVNQIEGNRWCTASIQKQNDSEKKSFLYVINPSDESEIIKIFKSHRFK